MVHTSELTPSSDYSFTGELWQDLDDDVIRRVDSKSGHSIAWHLWLIAHVEDVTMNMLVAGDSQLFDEEDWYSRLKVEACDTGNAIDRT